MSFTPDAIPVCRSATQLITTVVSGVTLNVIPTAMITIPGKKPVTNEASVPGIGLSASASQHSAPRNFEPDSLNLLTKYSGK